MMKLVTTGGKRKVFSGEVAEIFKTLEDSTHFYETLQPRGCDSSQRDLEGGAEE